MKEKGTLLVVGFTAGLQSGYCDPARAAGTLNFTGKIINESCQIANNGGDVNVDFGNVDMSALKSHEAKTAETPFTINLTGCPLAQNISISLEGTPDTNANGTAPPCWRSPMPRIPPKGWALKSSLPLTAQRKALS
ncbi:putative fimbrial-like protein [Klebsiella variicola]|uniref:Putative fimbrial-like protein n=1 Tax=Klebsiella variicola TaxID=244366 RepID=A0A7H4MK11_KLEVA|nr:putative fimbrial-like protein [Klebsiella variicola]